jgi:trk system potassium uptake protein TrkH
LNDPELRLYGAIITGATALITVSLVLERGMGLSDAGVHALFQTTTLLSTTGYATQDFNQWPSVARMMILVLMAVGGMAGSTAGGLKVVRLSVLMSLGRQGLRKLLHPRAVTPVRIGGRALHPDMVLGIAGFLVLYCGICLVSMLILTGCGHSIETALSATLSALSNVGPGLAEVGPAGNYGSIHPAGKAVLMAAMLLGRLEILTVFVIFGAGFWRK